MSERLEVTNRQFLSVKGLSVDSLLKISSYEDPAGSKAMGLLLDCNRTAGEHLREGSLENLGLQLRIFRSSLKSLITAEPLDRWREIQEALRAYANENREFLTPEFYDAILRVLEMFTAHELAEVSQTRGEKILNTIGHEKTLLVAETRRLSWLLSEWVEQRGDELHPETQVHLDSANFSRLKGMGFERVSFVGLPSMYLNRQKYQSQFRALVLSGIAPIVSFTGPSWLRRPVDARFTKHLLWELPGLKWPVPVLEGPEVNTPWARELDQIERQQEAEGQGVEDEEIEDLQSLGGEVTCRIIHIANSLGYAVEEEAQSVSILDLGSQEAVKIRMVHPFEELTVGDVLVANLAGSEQEVLRQKVREKVGQEEYRSFMASTTSWKGLSRQAMSSDAELFTQSLEFYGCTRVHRLSYWLSDECIMPQFEADFVALLKSLGMNATSIVEIVENSKRFLSLIRAAGREARKSLENSISGDQVEGLLAGETVSVEVDGFLGAEYLLSPVTMVEEAARSVASKQVRRIVRLREE